MDVYLMIRRGKLTLFLDAKENTTVADLKKMIEGITKQPTHHMKLYNREDMVNQLMLTLFWRFHPGRTGVSQPVQKS